MTWVLLVFLLAAPGDLLDTWALTGYHDQKTCLRAAMRSGVIINSKVSWWGCVTQREYVRLWLLRTGSTPPP